MKRIISAGIIALSVALACDQPASAWINFKFRVGFNVHWQSGGNSFLWGLFKNGHPGPEAYQPQCQSPGQFLPPGQFQPPGMPPQTGAMLPQGPYDFQSSYALPPAMPGTTGPVYWPGNPMPSADKEKANQGAVSSPTAYNLAYGQGYNYPASYHRQADYNPYAEYYNPHRQVGHSENGQYPYSQSGSFYPNTPFYPVYNQGMAWPYNNGYPSYWLSR